MVNNETHENVVLLFPGQGSQYVGMGKMLYQEFPEAKQVFQRAVPILGDSLEKLCFEGPDEQLRLTRNAQLAIFLVSVAAYEVSKRLNLRVSYAAGHSVGEFGALVAAGVLSFDEALKLVKRRGELMYEAGVKRPGTMSAILGISREWLETICADASDAGVVEIANINSPNQVVISGDPKAVKKAEDACIQLGAKRVISLPVSGAFHSKLMEEPAQLLAAELDHAKFHDARFPVISNITAQPVTKGGEIRELLKRQIRERVLWEDSMRFLIKEGFNTFIEMEPGSVLSGLLRSIDKGVKPVRLEQMLGLVTNN